MPAANTNLQLSLSLAACAHRNSLLLQSSGKMKLYSSSCSGSREYIFREITHPAGDAHLISSGLSKEKKKKTGGKRKAGSSCGAKLN